MPAIALDGHEVGRVTSSTLSPAVGKAIALGYVQRDHAVPDTVLAVGDARAVVAVLPFRPPAF